MSISLEPNKGLRLKLGRLTPIRTWHGGGSFWSHEFQLTVRSGALAGFLPRAIEDEDSVLFEHRGGGGELASTSTAISSVSEIPARELKALRDAVDELKKKAEDPHCDRTKRQMIEGFRLPDPQKDRDLYRLIGKGSSAKLIVLWGVEREEGSALAPGAAVDLMHTPAVSEEASQAPQKKSKLIPVLLILAALVGGGWYWKQEQEKQRLAAEATALAAQRTDEARIAAFNAAAAGTMALPGATASGAEDFSAVEEPFPEGAVVKDDNGAVKGIADSTGKIVPAEPGTTVDNDGKVTAAAKPGDVVKNENGAVTGVVDKDGKVTPATPGKVVVAEPGKPVTGPPGAVVSDSKGTVTGVLDKDGKMVAAKPGTTADKDGKITSSQPGTVLRNEKGAVTGIAGKDGRIVTPKPGLFASSSSTTRKTPAPGTVIRSSAGHVTGVVGKDGRITPASPGVAVDKIGRTTSNAPGTVIRDRSGVVTGVVDKDGRVTTAVPGKFVEGESGKTVTAPAGTVVRDRTGVVTGVVSPDGRVVTASSGTALDKDGKIVTGTPGTVFRDATGTVTGIADKDGKIVDATPGAVAPDPFASPPVTGQTPHASAPSPASSSSPPPPSGSVTTPMTTQGPPPAGISSLSVVSTSLSNVLGNGNVEVLLNVVARDTAGAVVNAPPITGWKVNGQLMNKPDGSPADGPVIPVSLPPGTHRISTVGKGADGHPFQTDADVLVTPKQ